jgi:hypothetical protein
MLFILGMILIGIVAFVAMLAIGALILYGYALALLWLPRQMYWIRAPFMALIILMAGGWLLPVVASMIHPKGPIVATVLIVAGVIGGDTWHYWRKKHAPPETLEYEDGIYWNREGPS